MVCDACGVDLPLPPRNDPDGVGAWVREHLADLIDYRAVPSPTIRGGQTAADAVLAGFSVRGYAGRRNEVWPRARRGASGLSPFVRHGLIDLPTLWRASDDGPGRDVAKFHDELLSKLVRGGLAARRPWLRVRMPRFNHSDSDLESIRAFESRKTGTMGLSQNA